MGNHSTYSNFHRLILRISCIELLGCKQKEATFFLSVLCLSLLPAPLSFLLPLENSSTVHIFFKKNDVASCLKSIIIQMHDKVEKKRLKYYPPTSKNPSLRLPSSSSPTSAATTPAKSGALRLSFSPAASHGFRSSFLCVLDMSWFSVLLLSSHAYI